MGLCVCVRAMSGEEARERQEAVERFLARAEMTMVGVLSLEKL